MFSDWTVIDLSIGIEDGPDSEPYPPSIERMDHREGAESLAENLREMNLDVTADDFPDGTALAWEESEGEPARRIDDPEVVA